MRSTTEKIILCLMTAMLVLGLASCGMKSSEKKDEPEETSEAQTNVAEEESEAIEAASEEESEAATEEPADTAAPVSAGNVINNGGHFVLADGRVYFHIPDKDAMETTGLFGSFIDGESGTTKLIAFDTASGETETILNDHSWGRISIAGDRMYLDQMIFDEDDMPCDETGVYDMTDGFKAAETYKGESVRTAAEDAGCVVTAIYDGDRDGFVPTAHFADGSRETVDSAHVFSCIACDSDRLYYSTYDYDTDEYLLYDHEFATKEDTCLGHLPGATYDYATGGAGDIDNVVLSGDGIFFTVSYYEGTGHFLTQAFLVSAKAGSADSVSSEEANVAEEVLPPFMVRNGSIDTDVDGAPLTAAVNNDGDLVYYDEDGNEHVVSSGYGTVSDGEGNMESMTECVEYVDGTIYGVRNELERAPEEDIGWRMSYRRTKTVVFSVDITSGEETEIISVTK